MTHLQTIKDLIEHISDEEICKLEVGGIIFDDSRKSILRSADSTDFQAVPGSGKTTVLVSKLLLIAERWSFENRGICVLSHTNVAKNEIHKKIAESGLGKNLLKYPHFIGTIQEFVDKYLAYPALKYKEFNINIIDTDTSRNKIDSYLTANYYTNLWRTKHPNQAEGSSYISIKSINPLEFNFPSGLPALTTKTGQGFTDAKQRVIDDGYFFFDDMYVFANYALTMYPNYINNVRNRFPLIFIDEAQDNNKTQDELLEKIFNDEHCIYQRFGDSDQAIYDFQDADGANTFGTNTDRLSDINISDSKRFPTGLIAKNRLCRQSKTEIRKKAHLQTDRLLFSLFSACLFSERRVP
ncbi:ATP-dependent helicase/nuclease subunit A [termite gut metagenome]|uniref:ATP-dependent helicase/nuclease subunit A n=1 Tax=termite gut metagenome TaxID=433724 RepID=A0A5J4RJ60_9ZZZZ